MKRLGTLRCLLLVGIVAACASDTTGGRTSGIVVTPAAERTLPDDAVLLYRSNDYGDDETRGSYDVYVPPSDTPLPVIVWVHGGGWSAGANTDIPILDLLDHGYAIASVGYRFAPDHTHPSAVDDVAQAVADLRTSADRFGVDGTTIILSGHSSGAHLALLAALTRPTEVVGVFAASTWNNMLIDPDDPNEIQYWDASVFDAQSAERQVARYLGCDPIDCPLTALAATPSTHAAEATMPIFLQHGTADHLLPVGETIELGDVLDAAGADVTVDLVDGLGHIASIDDALLAFLARVTNPG